MAAGFDGWRVACVAGFMAGAASLLGPSTVTAQSAPTPAQVTYTKDIAPILQRSCENCHRPDSAAPMSLQTYEEVRPWARAIKTRTSIGPHAAQPCWFLLRLSRTRL